MAYINELAWAQFNEALRVLKLSNHKDTLEHLRHLERTSETMLYALLNNAIIEVNFKNNHFNSAFLIFIYYLNKI